MKRKGGRGEKEGKFLNGEKCVEDSRNGGMEFEGMDG
jgi:hypothetical protein